MVQVGSVLYSLVHVTPEWIDTKATYVFKEIKIIIEAKFKSGDVWRCMETHLFLTAYFRD